jgi:hypothetical protein
MDDPLPYWQLKNLWSVLSGTAPLYRTTADRISKYREQFTRTQHYVSDWVKEIALEAMVNHRFLTQDRTIQESEFSSGKGVVVNLGDRDFSLAEGQIVKAKDYLLFEREGSVRKWKQPRGRNVFQD